MAKPRVFVSSTCYDLKEIRSQIRDFMSDYGYDPILSEFGDIFFDYGEHPQDSCFKEIEKCQMFVLIIGNSFGTTYYKSTNSSNPSSITMEEFDKSIKCDISKHIFINRFVDYDYQNYVRAWDKHIRKLHDEGRLLEEKSENKIKLRRDFDDAYPFPSDSYKNLFRFIDKIYSEGLGIQTFEFSTDIKSSLKQQWAGAMYDYLTKDKSVSKQEIQKLTDKIDGIASTFRSLIDGKNLAEDSLSFDLSSIRSAQNLSNVEEIKKEVFGFLEEILTDGDRVILELQQNATLNRSDITKWLNDLLGKIEIYKWQPYVSLNDIFSSIAGKVIIWAGVKSKVSSLKTIQFCITMKNLKEKLSENEYSSLIAAIYGRFKDIPVDDGLPF